MIYPASTREAVIAALRDTGGISVSAIAAAYGVHHQTVTRWARAAGLKLPTAAERIQAGGEEGTRRKWGDWDKRRTKARKLRARGKTLAEIARACGYRSLAAAHYAVRAAVPS